MITTKDEARSRAALLRRFLEGAPTVADGHRWGPEMRGRAQAELDELQSYLTAEPHAPLPEPGDIIDAWPDSKLGGEPDGNPSGGAHRAPASGPCASSSTAIAAHLTYPFVRDWLMSRAEALYEQAAGEDEIDASFTKHGAWHLRQAAGMLGLDLAAPAPHGVDAGPPAEPVATTPFADIEARRCYVEDIETSTGLRTRVIVPLGGIEHSLTREDALWLYHDLGFAVAESMGPKLHKVPQPASTLPKSGPTCDWCGGSRRMPRYEDGVRRGTNPCLKCSGGPTESVDESEVEP